MRTIANTFDCNVYYGKCNGITTIYHSKSDYIANLTLITFDLIMSTKMLTLVYTLQYNFKRGGWTTKCKIHFWTRRYEMSSRH